MYNPLKDDLTIGVALGVIIGMTFQYSAGIHSIGLIPVAWLLVMAVAVVTVVIAIEFSKLIGRPVSWSE